MLTEFFMERAQITLSADARAFVGTVPEFPELRVEAATPEACERRLRDELVRLLTIAALESPSFISPVETASIAADQFLPSPVHEVARRRTDAVNEATSKSQPAASPYAFREIIYEKSDFIARLTINRPDTFNAYSSATLKEMTAAFRDAASDRDVAVLVLTGTGDKAFCAGSDIEQHSREHLNHPDDARRWFDLFVEAHDALRQLGKPAIARINGIVAGSGNSWNLACDLAIAADHAKFAQIETKFGLISAGGPPQWLPLIVGERRAREMLLVGEPISANKALLWGLINDVVPYAELDATVNALCRKLIDRFPESLRQTREQLSYWKDAAWQATLAQTREWLAAQLASDEAREGLAALADKREIDYRAFRRQNARINPAKGESLSELEPASASQPISKIASDRERDCPSCGASGLPIAFQFCGLCGQKL
ncbi:MAG: naphthoate synthase [Blastocatellia bacterium]